MDFIGTLIFLDFLSIDHGRQQCLAEEFQVQIFYGRIQAGLGFEVGGIELPSLHQDALFFFVGNGFTGTNTDIDTTTEADWRKFGGLDFNDSDIAIRKGHLVYLHDRLRKDVALAAHGADILLKIVGILEAGARSVIVGADEQVTRLAGVHDVVGKGTDCLAELFLGVC